MIMPPRDSQPDHVEVVIPEVEGALVGMILVRSWDGSGSGMQVFGSMTFSCMVFAWSIFVCSMRIASLLSVCRLFADEIVGEDGRLLYSSGLVIQMRHVYWILSHTHHA